MKYSTLVRGGGIYDLVLTLPFAFPGSLPLVFGVLTPLNLALGGEPFPALPALGQLFVHLMGSLVVVWSILRIVRPRWEFGVADGAARGLFSLHYGLAIAAGGNPLGWFLLVPELLFGVAQGAGAWLTRRTEVRGGSV